MRLRPHHLLDIVTECGHGHDFAPHPYGHAVHTVAAEVLADQGIVVEFVCASDDICVPCVHLQADGNCDDVLPQLAERVMKQSYNDGLDTRLFPYLGMRPGDRMTVRAFLEIVSASAPGIENICAHPGEDPGDRLRGLRQGLRKLGIQA